VPVLGVLLQFSGSPRTGELATGGRSTIPPKGNSLFVFVSECCALFCQLVWGNEQDAVLRTHMPLTKYSQDTHAHVGLFSNYICFSSHTASFPFLFLWLSFAALCLLLPGVCVSSRPTLNWNFPCKYAVGVRVEIYPPFQSLLRRLPINIWPRNWISFSTWRQSDGHHDHIYYICSLFLRSLMVPSCSWKWLSQRVVRLMQLSCFGHGFRTRIPYSGSVLLLARAPLTVYIGPLHWMALPAGVLPRTPPRTRFCQPLGGQNNHSIVTCWPTSAALPWGWETDWQRPQIA